MSLKIFAKFNKSSIILKKIMSFFFIFTRFLQLVLSDALIDLKLI